MSCSAVYFLSDLLHELGMFSNKLYFSLSPIIWCSFEISCKIFSTNQLVLMKPSRMAWRHSAGKMVR